MSKILILNREINPGQQYDIWDKCANNNFITEYQKYYGNEACINFGNKLWFQSIVSIIQSPENEIVFKNNEMSNDYINSNFDMIIFPTANCFSEIFESRLEANIEFLKNIKIPVYMIACGVQADDYNHLDLLIKNIGDTSKRFIEAVYNTGGEFALRGFFSKQFFDKLGSNTAVVTGCPSLYQMGRNLFIDNKKVSLSRFNPIFNGDAGKKYCNEYKKSFFIDQETFLFYLYDKTINTEKLNSKEIYRLIKVFGYDLLDLLFSNRIKLFVSMNEWYNFIKENNFNFSYGSRIHGNIMPILAGVPALIYPKDSRVKEIAEFYSIPLAEEGSKKSLYEQYMEMDYSYFNNSFSEKYDAFEKFLSSHGIVNVINNDNIFLNDKKYDYQNVNNENLQILNKRLKSLNYKAYAGFLNTYRKISKRKLQ